MMNESSQPPNVGSNDQLGVNHAEVPNDCKTCRHRYNDIEEGHNCRRYDATIVLSDGSILKWPSQAVASAYIECRGAGYKRSPLGVLKWWLRI